MALFTLTLGCLLKMDNFKFGNFSLFLFWIHSSDSDQVRYKKTLFSRPIKCSILKLLDETSMVKPAEKTKTMFY